MPRAISCRMEHLRPRGMYCLGAVFDLVVSRSCRLKMHLLHHYSWHTQLFRLGKPQAEKLNDVRVA